MQLIVDTILKVGGVLFVVAVSIAYCYGLYKLRELEKKIFELQDQVDNIENDDESKKMLRSGVISQYIFEARNEKRKKPMVDKLNRLKMERQFLLDKIPLIGWFKR